MADEERIAAEAPEELTFPNGIPGFEDHTQYRLTYSDIEAGRVYRLQSCTSPDAIFTLVEPTLYSLNYELQLTDEEEALLQAEHPEQILVLLIVWKPETPSPDNPGLHANITGPILINAEKGLGLQKVIDNPKLALNISA
ncbi:Flagellar assembly factor fliW [Thiorhodococcus drewsii AZ1]|uniref:Flagellar assembly factor FliW n=1 Tax=Thiorhodococcus drewsii AZ1 TaxID=765913 RepID=G2DXH2_9GAMM|nr:flagellar assembly protein FliW [Thiorhodococcus drewsii]EGV33021.1 Flagellar assembly factor fliW [Thiorhodococcus drewsii AZ1]